jgi:glutamine---fructose-6-phosphate transaminase (isomerizing)
MTHFLHDILRQPQELQAAISSLCQDTRPLLEEAADSVRKARHVYLTGIGSSWHAALNAASLFYRSAFPILTRDAAELLHFDSLREESVIIIISRTGQSSEVVNLLPKARQSNNNWSHEFRPGATCSRGANPDCGPRPFGPWNLC